MRALVVDDDPGIRSVVTRILNRNFEQLEVVECENGVEALERLSESIYSLIVLDLQMPLMDGLDVLEAVRRTRSLRALPVIMMTGLNDEQTVRRIVSKGVTDFIVKPVRPRELSDRVSRVLSRMPAGVQAGVGAPPFLPLQIGPDTRVMIVEGSEEFRQFFRKCVASTCEVDEAASGLEAFQRCLANPPYAVFIGSDLGLVSGEILARKLRENSRFFGTRVIGIEPQRTIVQARRRGVYEAVIPRSFVADLFMAGFGSLLTRPGAQSALLSIVPDLKLVMISAAEEALSAALGCPVVLKGPGVSRPKFAIDARVIMTIDGDPLPVEVRLSVSGRPRPAQDATEAGGATATGIEEQLSTLLGSVVSTLGKELTARGLAVEWDSPAVQRSGIRKTARQGTGDDDATLELEFEAPDQKLLLGLSISLNGEAAGPRSDP